MYKRLELHNHTTESDANITVAELVDLMEKDQVDGVALTDHNTISGHVKIRKILEEKKSSMQCIYGMEYTTYYGHILCLNLKEYVPWENINLHKPELLFNAVKQKGALAGAAHPFSYGHPFARGCRFDMTITDFESVDFIEIFNNPEPLHQVNERGLLWWESLVLDGCALAFTSGMDLHHKTSMANQFATYIEGSGDGMIEKELDTAIRTRQTYISKGILLEIKKDDVNSQLLCTLVNAEKPGFTRTNAPFVLTLTTKKGTLSYTFVDKAPLTISYNDFAGETIVIPKLYQGVEIIENLICISPVIVFD